MLALDNHLRGVQTQVAETSVTKLTRHRRKIICMALALPLAYVAAVTVMYFNQADLIFPGARRSPPATRPPDPGVTQIWITTGNGQRVEAWYQAGAGRSPQSPGPAVIYFHGNADLIDTRWSAVQPYVVAGISALAVEYRGYGRCDGQPSQAALVADSVAFYDWLAARPDVDEQRIILHGLSLGGGVAAAVAEQRPSAALVLECTFTSVAALANRYCMPSFLCRHPFHTDRVLPSLNEPIAIFHGRNDCTIPVSHGRRLHELAPHSSYTELDCGHHDFRNDWENIRAFLANAGLLP